MWDVGDLVILRYVEQWGPVAGLPVRLLEDSAERVALYLAQGTELRWPAIGGRTIRDASLQVRYTSTWGHMPRVWDHGSVVFVFPAERAYGVWLFFDSAGAFRGEWYVNLQAPFVRTSIGFDTRDHTLDLWVGTDGSHRWKDEDELEAGVRFGFYTETEAAAFRAAGEQVLAEHPFPTGYESFRAEGDRPPPELPAGWAAAPSPLWTAVDESSRFWRESDDAATSQRR